MRRVLASICAFASNVLLAVGFALALLSHFLESERRIRVDDDRAHGRTFWLIVAFAVLFVGLLGWFKFFHAPAPAPEPPTAVTAPVTACTVTVNGKSGTVTLRPGDMMTLVARCAPDVQVVDLIVSVPPPVGVVGAERMESAGNGVYGGDTYPIPAEVVDVTVTFWVWADGEPADSVTVKVVR